jgi:transcription elongation factor Elf1
VFEILLKYRENGYKDWKDAILSVLPGRKEVQEKNNDGEDEAENS